MLCSWFQNDRFLKSQDVARIDSLTLDHTLSHPVRSLASDIFLSSENSVLFTRVYLIVHSFSKTPNLRP